MLDALKEDPATLEKLLTIFAHSAVDMLDDADGEPM